jgi:hypothetical protein
MSLTPFPNQGDSLLLHCLGTRYHLPAKTHFVILAGLTDAQASESKVIQLKTGTG